MYFQHYLSLGPSFPCEILKLVLIDLTNKGTYQALLSFLSFLLLSLPPSLPVIYVLVHEEIQSQHQMTFSVSPPGVWKQDSSLPLNLTQIHLAWLITKPQMSYNFFLPSSSFRSKLCSECLGCFLHPHP